MKTFHIFEARLFADGTLLKRQAILATDSNEAIAIAQQMFGPISAGTIRVQHNPEIFFECHG